MTTCASVPQGQVRDEAQLEPPRPTVDRGRIFKMTLGFAVKENLEHGFLADRHGDAEIGVGQCEHSAAQPTQGVVGPGKMAANRLSKIERRFGAEGLGQRRGSRMVAECIDLRWFLCYPLPSSRMTTFRILNVAFIMGTGIVHTQLRPYQALHQSPVRRPSQIEIVGVLPGGRTRARSGRSRPHGALHLTHGADVGFTKAPADRRLKDKRGGCNSSSPSCGSSMNSATYRLDRTPYNCGTFRDLRSRSPHSTSSPNA